MSAASGGLMSCVREASLEPPAPYRATVAHHTTRDAQRHGEGRKGRFLRGLRRMFRRRSGARPAPTDHSPDTKSRSTSELLAADIRQRRKEGAYSSGLSVSHDSVFTGDRSGDESSDDRPTPGHGLGHLSSGHRAELVAAVRRRGRDASDDDEDLGLPRSPPASPPTDKADKRHHAGISQSSCSDGSLLSVGSSEMDEDSSSGTHHQSHDNSARSDLSDLYMSEPPTGVAPLSHSAARHKMAVRPRRTHGAPRRKKNNSLTTPALPITPELNEEMIRSTTPDVTHKTSEVVTESFSSSTTTKKMLVKEVQSQFTKDLTRALETSAPGDIKMKSSSLPPGLALSHLVGQSPVKLSLADPNDSARSSIKRSKSSSQGKSLRDDSSQGTHTSTSETQIHTTNTYRSEERVTRYRSSNRYEEEMHTEKKSKSEKKNENETIKTSTKKDESFFSRLLLRRSGKKAKKEASEEGYDKKSKPPDKIVSPQYKPLDREYSLLPNYSEYGQRTQSAERNTQKSAGQRAFSNQVHKRMDNKGVYVQDNVYKDLHNVSKGSIIDYGANDLKVAEETDKMLNMDINMKYTYNKHEEKSTRYSSKDFTEMRNDSFSLHNDNTKRPPLSVQRLMDPYSSKAFISNEVAHLGRENSHLSPKLISDEAEGPIPIPRQRAVHNDFVFHSGSMPKNIPYFNQNLKLSSSASPPRSVLQQGFENIKQLNRSTEFAPVTYAGKEREEYDKMCGRNETTQSLLFPAVKQEIDKSFTTSEMKSLGEEFIETRISTGNSSIGKSHSFRHISENNSLSSQDNQMPSLPAIVGISEPLMENWEVNYRRSVSHDSGRFNARYDENKRLSARNYNVLNPVENYDSLPSTDSSYLDSLKDSKSEIERKSMFVNSVHIIESRKRDSDISQIEAKIDNIIGSPKPLITSVVKSTSLDSIKSTPEKQANVGDRRKTISIESALIHEKSENKSLKDSVSTTKSETESYVSITHLNRDIHSVPAKLIELPKLNKSDEKLQLTAKPGVPEFLKIQLNKVDSKPVTNVVLTANITPKKTEPSIEPETIAKVEENIIVDSLIDSNETPLQMYLRKTGSQQLLNRSSELLSDDLTQKPALPSRNSPLNIRKSTQSALPPQSPTTPKMFIKKKATSIDLPELKQEKSRTNSLSNDTSSEKIYETISMDRKSFSSFGSKTSLQSSDSNEARTPDRQDEGITYRKKPIIIPKEQRNGSKHDDEPELMKVFARRSLKLKDSEAEVLAQEIADANNAKEELTEISATKTKTLKNELNSSIKSRDSDKENEDQIQSHNTDDQRNDNEINKRNNDKVSNVQSRTSHFGSHYQRSVSATSVTSLQTTPKKESAPAQIKNDINKYKKEISDSTPEKRLRNRTFPDSSNEITIKNEPYKSDTISKRPWLQQKKEEDLIKKKVPFRNLPFIASEMKEISPKEREVIEESKEAKEMDDSVSEKESNGGEGEADGAPQFKGILQMRAEWERRAKQGMTK